MGKIARKSKFEGQLKAKLKKFKTSDLFTKVCIFKDQILLKIGVKLKKIDFSRSIEDKSENI
jgi:hypothetical protein